MLDAVAEHSELLGMAGNMLIFGMGYTASRLADALRGDGWRVSGTRRTRARGTVAFEDRNAVLTALDSATHILSSVPPFADGGDPVLLAYRQAIANSSAGWVGYLSSTGVYGDTGGAWVDESAAIGLGRRSARAIADKAWQDLREDIRVFRLPGIYGPGRSALDRVIEGKAHRVELLYQIFSRIHVDDIVSAVRASFKAPPGIYNVSDNQPASQNDVIEYACDLLGYKWPALQSLDDIALSPMARGFYAENRRISNQKAKRLLGWMPTYCDYKQGLAAISVGETENPD